MSIKIIELKDRMNPLKQLLPDSNKDNAKSLNTLFVYSLKQFCCFISNKYLPLFREAINQIQKRKVSCKANMIFRINIVMLLILFALSLACLQGISNKVPTIIAQHMSTWRVQTIIKPI